MRILWFEVTVPSAYQKSNVPIAGWQDSLERIVKTIPEIELIIAFISDSPSEIKVIDGVIYVPIFLQWSFYETKFGKKWDLFVEKMIPAAKRIVNEYRPDLIQVFGTEWPFGQIATYTDIPVVIHIMGSIVPYQNASYPPGYSLVGEIIKNIWKPRTLYSFWKNYRDNDNWLVWEKRTWKLVKYYMGRTKWDKSLSNVMHPNRIYFHVEEALRLDFLQLNYHWKLPNDNKLRLISTGCSSFWKGPDMMLKVAKVLVSLNIDFEWKVVGKINSSLKRTIEQQEGISFDELHINFIGFKKPNELRNILCSSTMYVHTAYIENSPNAICEAQCLGVPIVSTNVGGIASLIRQDIDGILVSANDPWQMANEILDLYNNPKCMQRFSESSRIYALERHNDENIKQQLLDCYKKITSLSCGDM